MEKNEHKCGILITLYKYDLYDYELMSWKHLCDLYGKNDNYIFTFLSYYDFDFYKFINKYDIPNKDYMLYNKPYNYIQFDKSYFAGSNTYNILCLDKFIYNTCKKFGYDYLFNYQFDGYVFNDELDYWINKGYSYIGGFGGEISSELISKIYTYLNLDINDDILNKRISHMNGGLCLKNIDFCLDILDKYSNDDTLYYIMHDSEGIAFGEDTFFSLFNKSYVSAIDSLKFGYLNYRFNYYAPFNEYRYPFTCHGINRDKLLINFVKQFNKEHNLNY